ncbi:hypothetical protein BZA70DRAFT_302884 [Myxozyma melibiosi]|uniref:Uncharacterized protein n=1 Tax=Myxozyma melibiosi TaxID=54550 RepID=A0ABR1EYD8_9ASCO
MRDNPMIANRLLLGLVLLVYSASEVLAKDWVATDICYSDDLGNNLCYDPVSLTPFEYIQLQSVGSETVVNYDVSPSQMGIDYMNYVYGTDNVTHARHLFGISKRASDWRDYLCVMVDLKQQQNALDDVL